jgi:proline iminopeptidase
VADLPRISQPALVVCGMHDELTPACAQKMHDALPNSTIRVFKNSSHLPMWEEPEEYFSCLLSFLDRHSDLGKR